MKKIILITGSTDGIGLETARKLVENGHHILLHGRNPQKLESVRRDLSCKGTVEVYIADLSDLNEVKALANAIKQKHNRLDVLINNAGVFKTSTPLTKDGFDIRFMVNTIAPYVLTKELLSLFDKSGRIINLSSAAQAPVNLNALEGKHKTLEDIEAYSQSKLAITMWSRAIAPTVEPTVIAVNPGSLLASKMVKEGFGVSGHDLSIGADILMKLSLDNAFNDKSGEYFDNDQGHFSLPHPDGLDDTKCTTIIQTINNILTSQEKM